MFAINFYLRNSFMRGLAGHRLREHTWETGTTLRGDTTDH